jgi:hypothetical protein
MLPAAHEPACVVARGEGRRRLESNCLGDVRAASPGRLGIRLLAQAREMSPHPVGDRGHASCWMVATPLRTRSNSECCCGDDDDSSVVPSSCGNAPRQTTREQPPSRKTQASPSFESNPTSRIVPQQQRPSRPSLSSTPPPAMSGIGPVGLAFCRTCRHVVSLAAAVSSERGHGDCSGSPTHSVLTNQPASELQRHGIQTVPQWHGQCARRLGARGRRPVRVRLFLLNPRDMSARLLLLLLLVHRTAVVEYK